MAYGSDGDGNDFDNLIGGDFSVAPMAGEYRKGVFADYPAMTPKYTPTNDDRSLETMARLLVPMSGVAARNAFIASFGKPGASEAQKLANVLATVGGEAVTEHKRYGLGYIDFLLTSAVESYQEKVQIVDVLSDNYVSYYFGAAPSVFQYSGVLLNSKQDDWRSAFTVIYNDIIRGTELARRRAVVTLAYDNMAVTGTIMNMSQNFSADGPFYQMAASFNFSLLVQRIDIERILDSKSTQLKDFPSYIKPGEFATRQFEVPPKTIRTTGMPSTQTVERKKEKTTEVYNIVDMSDSSDVHGAGRTSADDELDKIDADLGGQQSIQDQDY